MPPLRMSRSILTQATKVRRSSKTTPSGFPALISKLYCEKVRMTKRFQLVAIRSWPEMINVVCFSFRRYALGKINPGPVLAWLGPASWPWRPKFSSTHKRRGKCGRSLGPTAVCVDASWHPYRHCLCKGKHVLFASASRSESNITGMYIKLDMQALED